MRLFPQKVRRGGGRSMSDQRYPFAVTANQCTQGSSSPSRLLHPYVQHRTDGWPPMWPPHRAGVDAQLALLPRTSYEATRWVRHLTGLRRSSIQLSLVLYRLRLNRSGVFCGDQFPPMRLHLIFADACLACPLACGTVRVEKGVPKFGRGQKWCPFACL